MITLERFNKSNWVDPRFEYHKEVKGHKTFLGARINGYFIGYIAYLEAQGKLSVLYIEVDKQYRNRGIATLLVMKLLDDFRPTSLDLFPGTIEGQMFWNALRDKGLLPANTNMGGV